MSADRARFHPVVGANLVGLLMALLTVFVGMRWYVEAAAWAAILVLFVLWGVTWIRTPDFGAGVWIGVFLGIWSPILQAVFLGTFLANAPWHADLALTRGGVFWSGIAMVAVYAVVLGLVQFGVQKVRSRDLRPVPPVPPHDEA